MSPVVKKIGAATMADLEALPEHVKGEIIEGMLYTQARPRPRHADMVMSLGGDLRDRFQQGRGGPGGWWIVAEPGVRVPTAKEFSPDIAGWRKERMPELPARAFTTIPDWVCEVLSPSNRSYDLRIKRPFYARIGVEWLWLVDIEARVLLVNRLVDGRWVEMQDFGDETAARIQPFDTVELPLASLWPPPLPDDDE